MPIFTSIGTGILTALGVTGSMAVGAAPFATAIGLAATAAAGYGAYAAGSSLQGGKSQSGGAAPVIPSAPTPEAASATAQTSVEKLKRIRALSGGKTLLTSEAPTLSSGAGKTLLGS